MKLLMVYPVGAPGSLSNSHQQRLVANFAVNPQAYPVKVCEAGCSVCAGRVTELRKFQCVVREDSMVSTGES